MSRKNVAIKRIVKQAIEHGFSDLIVVHEDRKKPSKILKKIKFYYLFLDGMVISHFPDGPTAYFKINSLQYSKEIKVFF